MKICTSKQDIKKTVMKEILKEEGFRRKKYDSTKFVIIIEENDDLCNISVGTDFISFFGREIGLSLRPAKLERLEIIDNYIILRFMKNIIVFSTEDKFNETINLCFSEIEKSDGTILFRSNLVAERRSHCISSLKKLSEGYVKVKGENINE